MGSLVTLPVVEGYGVLDKWSRHQSAAGHTERTVTQRVKFITALAQHAGCAPLDLHATDLIDYLARDLQPWSKRTYFMHGRAWFRWLHSQGLRETDETAGLPVPKAPRVLPRPMSDQALAQAISTAGPRVAAFLTLAAFAGLRACEIAAVRGEDVDEHTLTVRGKGGSLAPVPTHPRVWELAQDHPRRGFWFPGSERGHIQAATVSKRTSEHLKRHGIVGTLHRGRHWFATNALRSSGGSLPVVQGLMRHASITSTVGYVLVLNDEGAAAVASLPDLPTGLRAVS